MGCSSSKVDDAISLDFSPAKIKSAAAGLFCRPTGLGDVEAPVMRCKDRKQLMHEAVAARNAFAAAHAAFAVALKNAGSALSDYGRLEFSDEDCRHPSSSSSPRNLDSASASSAPASAASVDDLPPPPPLLPDYFSPVFPMHKAEMNLANIPEEDEEVVEEEANRPSVADVVGNRRSTTPSTSALQAPSERPSGSEVAGSCKNRDGTVKKIAQAAEGITEDKVNVLETRKASEKVVIEPEPGVSVNNEPTGTTKQEKAAASSLSMLQVLQECDDQFLNASDSAQEVSQMLEASQMHYHTNFADNKGHIDYAAIVMQTITWNRSFKGISPTISAKDDLDDEKWDTHAVVLDKILAWETKLYDEVKAAEHMKADYQRKVALLNKLKEPGSCSESYEKAKSAVRDLHVKHKVDIQSIDSIVLEIERLRDYKLYPKLVHLVGGMVKMWESMTLHHRNQQNIITKLGPLDRTHHLWETSDEQVGHTEQLLHMISDWNSQLKKLMDHQKSYVSYLNSWLRLSPGTMYSDSIEDVSSLMRPHEPPINALLRLWQDEIENLPIEMATNAIHSLSEVIVMILQHQKEKKKQKEKLKNISKEYERMVQALESRRQKDRSKRAATTSEDANIETEDHLSEGKQVLSYLKSKMDVEEERYKKLCKQVKERSYASLRRNLPELFRYTLDFALKCSEMHKKLLTYCN